MRLFTGISLPPEARAPLLAVTEQLRPLAKLAWSPEEKLHITTKFIGEWPESRLAELQQVLTAVHVAEPVDIHIRGFGWMPTAFYAGVTMTGDLNRATEEVLEAVGILREKRLYNPHITLGRIRKAGRDPLDALQAALPHAGLDIAPFRAAAFHLYLSANGTYTRLNDYPLPT